MALFRLSVFNSFWIERYKGLLRLNTGVVQRRKDNENPKLLLSLLVIFIFRVEPFQSPILPVHLTPKKEGGN